ncbi:MAG: hypothetical protein ACRDPY_03775 [Streptosporangiaceae bacterium]
MSRRSRLFRYRLISVTGALVAVIAFFAVPAQASHAWTTCSDCYIVTPGTNPAAAAAGTGEQYAFAVTNNDPHETLRSLTFAAPADFVITGASGPSGTWVSALPGSSVTLKLPNEPTGTTFAVDVTALAPCTAAGSEAWGVSGVDSRGETNEVHWSSSPLSVSVTGTCGLAFTGQPAQTAVNSDILTGFNSTGSPLAVQLLDADGDPLNAADFSAGGTAVTVSLQANPGGGTLAGTTTVTSSAGVADFGNLQINKAGVGYDLAANATGFSPGTSSPFTITGMIQACGNGSCSVSQSTATTSTSVTATAPGDFAALGLGGVSLACNHYVGVADTADFGIFTSAGNGVPTASAIATLTISRSALQSLPWLFRFLPRQVCYGSPTPFPAIPGTSGTTVIGGVTYHTGLLLSCFLVHKGPCLISRRYTPAGAVQLTFVTLGDPIWHG